MPKTFSQRLSDGLSSIKAMLTADQRFAGIFGSFFRLLLGWADIPDSFCEVALSFVLLVVTHTALRALASLATEQLQDSGQLEPAVGKAVDRDGPDGTRWAH